MASNYMLEIYEPDCEDTVICSEYSEIPFPRFEAGDEFNYLGSMSSSSDQRVIVSRVEYIIWMNEHIKIKTLVFTKTKNK